MKTKKDFNPLIHSRFLHKDYDTNLSNDALMQKQTEARKNLIDEFKKSFGLDGPINKYTIESKDGSDIWFYSVCDARGSTMIIFAKWIVGLECIYNHDITKKYTNFFNSSCFNLSEQQYLNKYKNEASFVKLLTAKKSFIKCFNAEYLTDPNFNKCLLSEKDGYLIYTINGDKYICEKGISDKYTIYVCHKE